MRMSQQPESGSRRRGRSPFPPQRLAGQRAMTTAGAGDRLALDGQAGCPSARRLAVRRRLPAQGRYTRSGAPRATGGDTAIALIGTWPRQTNNGGGLFTWPLECFFRLPFPGIDIVPHHFLEQLEGARRATVFPRGHPVEGCRNSRRSHLRLGHLAPSVAELTTTAQRQAAAVRPMAAPAPVPAARPPGRSLKGQPRKRSG